jgi:hypothetical protein
LSTLTSALYDTGLDLHGAAEEIGAVELVHGTLSELLGLEVHEAV